jgi:dipeptidyl aminopeptidase/acylaminoacyl peptidase
MKPLIAGVLLELSVFGAVAAAQPGEQVRAIIDVRPVVLPAYEAYPRIALYAPTRAEYDRAAGDRSYVMERLTYRSDGLNVYAYLYRPTAVPAKKLPVVIFNRGSYTREDFSPEVLMMGQRLARQGYLVVAPMLRGSGGAPGHDQMGGDDLHDLFNLLPVIRELPAADSARLFLYGESRGGIMSLLAARENFPARAAAVWGAITDMGLYLAGNGNVRRLAPSIWPDFVTNEAAIIEARSAVRWPERISLPVLLMNGGADTDVPPIHALQLASTLHRLGKPFELKVFYGEPHVLSGRAEERDADAVRWFRRFDTAPPAQ